MPRKKDERQNRIRQLLMNQQEMKVSEIAERLTVTPETIRKDLDELEEQGLVIRSHGSVSLKSVLSQLPLKIRNQDHPDEKRRITMRAIQEIRNGSTIFFDSGSTIMTGIQMLRSKKNLKIVTISLPVAIECTELGFEVYLLGGQIQPQALFTYGSMTMDDLKRFHFDLALLGTCGVLDSGFFGLNSLDDAAFFREVAARSSRVMILMDRSKIYEKAVFPTLSFAETNMMITNPLSEEERARFDGVEKIAEV